MKLKSWIFEGIRWIAAAAMIVCLVMLFGGDPVSSAEFADVSGNRVKKIFHSFFLCQIYTHRVFRKPLRMFRSCRTGGKVCGCGLLHKTGN